MLGIHINRKRVIRSQNFQWKKSTQILKTFAIRKRYLTDCHYSSCKSRWVHIVWNMPVWARLTLHLLLCIIALYSNLISFQRGHFWLKDRLRISGSEVSASYKFWDVAEDTPEHFPTLWFKQRWERITPFGFMWIHNTLRRYGNL